MSKSLNLWTKAKKLIPGGSQLLSKRSEMFLPDYWPSYYKKAEGIDVWDLDDNRYTDMSIMGIGTCIFGYSDPDINEAVKQAINNGVMSTFNCYEEVELAEKLLERNKWAGKVRYSRTGGEALSIAVRIGRAYSRKDKVAFCGYHGWHDWYLSANLQNKDNLDEHLLEGLNPNGVPKSLSGTMLPFSYNKIEELELLVSKNDIGVIVLETTRNFPPEGEFLTKVREIADRIGAVLIMDEVTAGFRMNINGAFDLYNMHPDIAVFAKAISNGFAMAAIVGKSEIMDYAQESFISSTYWTERIGPTAALATIQKMERTKHYEQLVRVGKMIKSEWKNISDNHGLSISTFGIDPIPHFAFEENNLTLKTYITQEMLSRGYLANAGVYLSYVHTKEVMEPYLEELNEVFKQISQIGVPNIKKHLKGPVAHSGFQRIA